MQFPMIAVMVFVLSCIAGVLLGALKLVGLCTWPVWVVLLPWLPPLAMIGLALLGFLSWVARGSH